MANYTEWVIVWTQQETAREDQKKEEVRNIKKSFK